MIINFKLFENKTILPEGTTVRVLPNILDYIKKHNLPKGWNGIIGKILEIEEYLPNNEECGEDVYSLNVIGEEKMFGFLVPLDCVEKVNIESKSSEHDPWGEEDWDDEIYTLE